MEGETRYAKSGDLRIAYQVHGDGPIDLVFAPGYLSHLEQNQWWPGYATFFEKMAAFSRLIIFDRRGTGLSDRILALGSFEELMDDIGAVLDAVGSERAALFGGAEGGPMCVLFAATFPERTSALVLGASYARRTWAPDLPLGPRRGGAAADPRRVRGAVGQDRLRRALRSRPRSSTTSASQVWYAQAQRFSGTPASAREWFRMTMEIDVRDVLPAIRVPTLVHPPLGRSRHPGRGGPIPGRAHPRREVRRATRATTTFRSSATSTRSLDEIEEFLTGSRRAREPDRVLATVLFTDIVGSTERAAELGDRRWTELLAEHHRIVRAELERSRGKDGPDRGRRVARRRSTARRARFGCAAAIRDGVRALGIEIRAGLHTGEIELAETGVEGIAVHIGARVAALAGPGEVLVSSTVKDLVVGSGIVFVDRGCHELKGVPGEWQLYAVDGRPDAAELRAHELAGLRRAPRRGCR